MVAAEIRGLPRSDQQVSELLRLRVIRGEKIGKRDLFGLPDPYCVVRLENDDQIVDEVTLERKKNTRNPQWNSALTFRVTSQCLLKVQVYDEHKIRKDALLGQVEIPLGDGDIPISTESRQALPYELKCKNRMVGTLWLALHFLPMDASPSDSSSTLTDAVVPQASDMPAGWEEREDGNGRTFFINHILRRTQFERPGCEGMESQFEERRRRDAYEHRSRVADEPDAVRQTIDSIDEGMRANFDGAGQSDDSSGDEVPLPSGWDMQVAPNGRVFFIDHSTKTTTWTDPRTGCSSNKSAVAAQKGADDDIGALPEGWEQRTHIDGRVFFIDHNSKRTQWEDPRFENESIAGPAIPYSRDYKRKVEYLRSKLPRAGSNGKCDMVINRDSIFEDSYRQIMGKAPSELRHKLWIEFSGETGLDYGGVTREWFFLLSHEIFNPYYGLFEYSATDNYTLQINPHSGACIPDHLNYFYFIGKIMGMAIYHGKLLDAFFIRPFYKMMLNKKISLFDMESVDNSYYNSLIYVKDNDPTDLELTFALDDSFLGETQTVELIEGGKNVAVTEENKERYIEAVVSWRFVKRVEQQMEQVLRGLHEVVPSNLLRIFDSHEVELLMCGLQKIDVKDWKANTVYKGGYGPSSQTVHNFWKCLLSFDNEMRARVLQFVSGTSRVPMNGFRELYGSNGPQKFTIEKWGSGDMLPRAHTCFNRLDLPPYTTYQELKQKLMTAIENSDIFSGVD